MNTLETKIQTAHEAVQRAIQIAEQIINLQIQDLELRSKTSGLTLTESEDLTRLREVLKK